MSKDEWIAQKIAKLIDEGKAKDEAVAIANSMWEDEHTDKELSEAADRVDAAIVAPEVEAVTVAVDEKALFGRIWDGIQQKLGLKSDDATGFKVAGNHYLTVWSNNFKDRDGEIFTEKAIDDYIARVDMGIVPKPELWVWHIPGTRIGQAKTIARHGHFVLALGEFDNTPDGIRARDYYAKHAHEKGISHGFTYPSDKLSNGHYHHFNTFENSPLPLGAEANLFTSLEGVKAAKMDERKQHELEEIFGKERAQQILANLDKRGKALEELGVEFKDFTAADPQDVTVAADKEAVEHADKAFSDLLAEMLESSAEPVTAALEAVKAVKEARAEVQAQNGVIEALRKEFVEQLAELKQRLDDAPRRASKDLATRLKDNSAEAKGIDAMLELEKQQSGILSGMYGNNGNGNGAIPE